MVDLKVESLEVPKQEVETELKNLKKGIKEGYISKRQKLTKQLLSIYAHLQHGGKIIDVPETFTKTGLRKEDLPKLGIVPVNAKRCYLYKKRNGERYFRGKTNRGISMRKETMYYYPPTLLDGKIWKIVDGKR